MNKVWIVMAAHGDYSDRHEWPLAAYTTEKQAKGRVDELTALVRVAQVELGDAPSWKSDEDDFAWNAWYDRQEAQLQKLNLDCSDLYVSFFLHEVEVVA